MTYEELIEEAGAEIGIEGFAPDEDGVCVIASDIGEIAVRGFKGPCEAVLLTASVTDVPADAGAALLEALKANRGFKDTKGATLSVDPETRRFELLQYAFLEDLDPDKFVAMVEDFATTLVNVRERLEGASLAGAATPEDLGGLGLGEFIRV
jgi:hypothetical protein